MMLDNCTYNKVKLMHELSSLVWFIQRHGLADAESASDAACMQILLDLEEDLKRHIERLHNTVNVITQ